MTRTWIWCVFLLAASTLAAVPVCAEDCLEAQRQATRAHSLLDKSPGEALDIYKRAAGLCPGSAALRYDAGLASMKSGDPSAAARSFEEALDINPSLVEALNGLAMAYATAGTKWEEAGKLIDMAIKLRPGDPALKDTKSSLDLLRSVHDLAGVKPAPSSPDAYAVVIGIERYRDLTPVDTAANDARWMKEYLIRLAGVPEENLVLLTNDRATRTDLFKYLNVWLQNHVTKDSSVYVYFAGHGAPDVKTKKAYIVPYDGDPNYLDMTAYPLDLLYDALGKLPAKNIVVMLDSCFSGRGERSVVAEGMRPVALSIENPMLSTGNTVVMSAAQGTEASSFYREAGHGLFTYFLLEGMRGKADADGDGWVEAQELFDYIKPNVSRLARRLNREQTPTLSPPTGPAVEGRRLIHLGR